MIDVKDFLLAALPWVIMGLCAAILCTRLSEQKESDQKAENRTTEGMVIGLAVGSAFSFLLDGNTAISLSLGMLIGMTIGSFIPKEKDEEI